jgi:hypothetical protein
MGIAGALEPVADAWLAERHDDLTQPCDQVPALVDSFDRLVLLSRRAHVSRPEAFGEWVVGQEDMPVASWEDVAELPVLVGVEALEQKRQLSDGEADRRLTGTRHRLTLSSSRRFGQRSNRRR